MVGTTIMAYGQTATIVNVVTVSGQMLIYLDRSITVPTAEGSRDHISVGEIQR